MQQRRTMRDMSGDDDAERESTESNSQGVTQLVVVGASAGGVEALATLVSTLPADFAAPIVVAQHLSPSRASHLVEILGPRSPLPVRSVQTRENLERGVIYLVPADRDVEITDHEVLVTGDGNSRLRPKPSIDRLL